MNGMIKTDKEIWNECTLEKSQDECDYCITYPIRYFNKDKNRVWVDRDSEVEFLKNLLHDFVFKIKVNDVTNPVFIRIERAIEDRIIELGVDLK